MFIPFCFFPFNQIEPNSANVPFSFVGTSASVLSDPLQLSCPCVCVCLVHQVIVHEVPGQELELEVYDKDPDQDDFLGRYICTGTLHTSIFGSLCFICHPSQTGGIKYLFKQKLKCLLLWCEPLSKHQNELFYWTLSSFSRYRITLDLGIVKKSIVVDDVSRWRSFQSILVQYMQCSHLCMAATVSTVVHFERHWVWTGSFQTGVVVPAAQHRPPGAGLSHSAHIFPTLQCILSLKFQSFSPDPEEKRKHYEQSGWSTFFSYLGCVCGQGWGTSCESHFYPPCPHACSSQCCFLCLWLSWAIALN